MEFIKEYCPATGKAVIRINRYGSGWEVLLMLVYEAKQDFPTLEDTSIEVVHFEGQRYKHTFGIEFPAHSEDVPAGYKAVEQCVQPTRLSGRRAKRFFSHGGRLMLAVRLPCRKQ